MNMVMKRLVLASALCLTGLGVTPVIASEMTTQSVATVNLQQVLQQSPRIAAMGKQLEADFKVRQAQLGSDQKALQTELDKFKQDGEKLSQKDRDNMQKKIASDRAEFVKKVVAYQQDLQKAQGKVMQTVLHDLNGIVSSIAKQQSYALVLDSQAVIYSLNSVDITKDVVKKFNDQKA